MSMRKGKIRLIFDGSVLASYLNKNSGRSGIFFVAYNLLRELSKNEKLEIAVYYHGRTVKEMEELKRLNIIPQSCKLIEKPFFRIIEDFYFCHLKNGKDNLVKKVARYIIARFRRLYEDYLSYILDFRGEIGLYDVYLSPADSIPKMLIKKKCYKTYLLIHDIIPYVMRDFYGQFNRSISSRMQMGAVKAINNKGKYFAVSEYTKQDVLKNVKNVKQDSIVVTYPAAGDNFYCESDSEIINKVKLKYNIDIDKKYFFSLCTIEPRKNLAFALNNFIKYINKNKIHDLIFVLGGAPWEGVWEYINGCYDTTSINFIGYVDDSDLSALYSGSQSFVYPSLYEGFGLPVLEAMKCGCPVITSNVSSLPEVIGDCGILIDPTSDEEMIEAYKKMYTDREFRSLCVEKGLERAKQFSWKKSADIMYETFLKDLM